MQWRWRLPDKCSLLRQVLDKIGFKSLVVAFLMGASLLRSCFWGISSSSYRHDAVGNRYGSTRLAVESRPGKYGFQREAERGLRTIRHGIWHRVVPGQRRNGIIYAKFNSRLIIFSVGCRSRLASVRSGARREKAAINENEHLLFRRFPNRIERSAYLRVQIDVRIRSRSKTAIARDTGLIRVANVGSGEISVA